MDWFRLLDRRFVPLGALLLIERGVEINSKDKEGRTPLSWAVMKGDNAVVQLLIERGADINSKDNWGETSLSWAVMKGYKSIVQLLVERKVEIESRNIWGETPLSQAAGNGHEAIIQLLIERGAEVNSRDVLGQTPLSLAMKGRHEALTQLLVERDAESDTKAFLWAIGDGLEALVRLSILLDLIEFNLEQRWVQDPSSWTTEEKKAAYLRLYMERDVYKYRLKYLGI